jgi:hypothetical protein
MKLLFILFILQQSLPAISQTKWNTYTANTPSKNLYLTFKYPSTVSVNNVDNGVCLNRINHSRSAISDKNFPTQWCIWFMDASMKVDDCITKEKSAKESNSKVQLSEQRDSITVAGLPALKVLLNELKSKKKYVEMIFFEKDGILFEIDNRKFDNEDFKEFLAGISF